jgi:hypothetical protein
VNKVCVLPNIFALHPLPTPIWKNTHFTCM